MIERHFADAARRFVDDAQKRQVVARVDQESQIGENVAVLFALEEGQAAHDLVRHALLYKGRLQAARQGVNAEKDGEIAVRSLARFDFRADAPSDSLGLVHARMVGQHGHWPPGNVVGDEVHRFTLLVVRDEMAGRRKNGSRAAIVRVQREDAGVGKIAFKIEYVTDV